MKSDRVKKLFSIRNYSLAICAIFIGYCMPLLGLQDRGQKQDGWTKEQEQILYNQTRATGKTLGLTEGQSHQFATCAVSVYKAKYPNGLKGVSKEELYEIGRIAGKTCTPNVQNISLRWTPESEKMIKDYFINSKDLESLSSTQKESLATCVLDKLKKKYPKGLAGKIPEQDAQQLGTECIGEVF